MIESLNQAIAKIKQGFGNKLPTYSSNALIGSGLVESHPGIGRFAPSPSDSPSLRC